MRRHTFLLEEGLWIASGYYTDRERRRVGVTGRVAVTHRDGRWQSDSRLDLDDHDDPYLERCLITPVSDDRRTTGWCSENSLFGRLRGCYTFVEDSILANYAAEDGPYHGVECWLQVFEEEYTGRGAVFAEGRRIASWKVDLVRERGGPGVEASATG